MPTKKLIEVALPLDNISSQMDREKMARTGRPSTIHLWWTRKTLAEERAVLFASLVDDPSAHPELFESEELQTEERTRLIGIIDKLIKVENTNNVELINEAINEIKRYSSEIPECFDPFAGGASIPLEAQRFGLRVIANDLNPVAALINKALLEIPPLFSGKSALNLSEKKLIWQGAEGLASDVRYYGNKLCSQAIEVLKHNYPTIEDTNYVKRDVFSWIWARTLKCPNPSCDCNIPLAAGFDLSKKKGNEVWAEPVLRDGKLVFKIHREKRTDLAIKAKAGHSAVFKCPKCGEITTAKYVKEESKKSGFDYQMMAVVADDGGKHIYLEPDELQIKCADLAKPEDIPHGELPKNSSNFAPPNFGLMDYADLYTNRQLVFLTTLSKLIKDMQKKIEQDAIDAGWSSDSTALKDKGCGAKAYSEAICVYLGMSLSKMTDRSSALTSWDSSAGGKIRNVFSRASMPMIWDFAETNPFYSSSGSLEKTINATADAIELLPAKADAIVNSMDAANVSLDKNAMVVTDLPYYERADYANLSDFFYVWLRYVLKDIYPELFVTITTPKDEELATFAYRYEGDKQAARMHYISGIRSAIKKMEQIAVKEYPSNISFFYKRNSSIESSLEKYSPNEWDEFIVAISDAGFVVTASWPIGRTIEKDIRKAELKGIPISLVVRKKNEDAEETTRRRFVVSLKRELPAILNELACMGIGVYDLRTSAIGRAWNIFTRYKKVIDADGTEMSAVNASYLIEQELDVCLDALYNQKDETNKEEV